MTLFCVLATLLDALFTTRPPSPFWGQLVDGEES